MDDIKIMIDYEISSYTSFSAIIVDEADLWVANNACRFIENDLAGLYLLRNAKRAHLMTATVTPFMQRLLN